VYQYFDFTGRTIHVLWISAEHLLQTPQTLDLRRIKLIDQDILAGGGAPETSINDPIVQKPTTNSLYCFPSKPLPLSVCFPRRLSSLSVSSAYPSRLLSLSRCGEREFE
jgi:hypothetical protein